MRYFAVSEDEFSVVNHPLQPDLQHWHILTAPLLIFAAGVIWSGHALKHYKSRVRRGRRTGITLMATLFPMIFSGYALQISAGEDWTRVWMWLHIATSSTWLLFALIHPLLPQKSRSADS
ncbi:MAG: hypothetical protein ACI8X5_002009 [Planctomycetota bacterium]|jgi:hypothetical protein